MNQSNTVVLPQTELEKIKSHSKLTGFDKKHNTDHISAWAQRIRNEKKKKDEVMRSKFDKEETIRRQVDLQEAEYQQGLANQLLYKSNQQIFENDPKIRRFYSKMLFSDVQEENGRLMGLKERLDREKELMDEALIRQQMETEEKIFKEQAKAGEEQRWKRARNLEEIKEQREWQKQAYISSILNDKVEGQLVRERAAEEAQEKEWQRKQRERKYNQYKGELAQHLELVRRQKKELEEKERREDEARKHYEDKKHEVMTVRKLREKSRLDAITAQRDKAIQIQEQAMKSKSDNENLLLERHLQQMEHKRAQQELAKQQEHHRMLAEMNDFALMSKNKKHQQESDEAHEATQAHLQQIESLDRIAHKELADKQALNARKLQIRKAQEDQIDHKQKHRQQQYYQELLANETRQNNYKSSEEQFDQWAQQQIKDYESKGYRVGPAQKELFKIQEQRRA